MARAQGRSGRKKRPKSKQKAQRVTSHSNGRASGESTPDREAQVEGQKKLTDGAATAKARTQRKPLTISEEEMASNAATLVDTGWSPVIEAMHFGDGCTVHIWNATDDEWEVALAYGVRELSKVPSAIETTHATMVSMQRPHELSLMQFRAAVGLMMVASSSNDDLLAEFVDAAATCDQEHSDGNGHLLRAMSEWATDWKDEPGHTLRRLLEKAATASLESRHAIDAQLRSAGSLSGEEDKDFSSMRWFLSWPMDYAARRDPAPDVWPDDDSDSDASGFDAGDLNDDLDYTLDCTFDGDFDFDRENQRVTTTPGKEAPVVQPAKAADSVATRPPPGCGPPPGFGTPEVDPPPGFVSGRNIVPLPGVDLPPSLGLPPEIDPLPGVGPLPGTDSLPGADPSPGSVQPPGSGPPPGFGPPPEVDRLPGIGPLGIDPLPGGSSVQPPGLDPPPELVPLPGIGPLGTDPLPGADPSPGSFPPPGLSPPPGFGPPPEIDPSEGVDAILRKGWMANLARMDARVVELGVQLGRGGCAVVHRLTMKDAGLQKEVDQYTGCDGLVVKMVPEGHNFSMEVAMKRELEIVARIPSQCHPNVMDFVSWSEANLCIVMPAAFCDLGDMLVHKEVLLSMTRGERMSMLAGAARGLHHVHEEIGLTHCDVKPENFMVTLAMKLKIADFGVSGPSGQETVAGLTKRYAAPEAAACFMRPEIQEKAKLAPSLDVYAFGLILIQMLYVQEESRLDAEQLFTHGLSPSHSSFEQASANVNFLKECVHTSGTDEDKQRLREAIDLLQELHEDYAAQTIRMSNLYATLLASDKWEQPGGLLFPNEVNLLLCCMLNQNPERRPSLDTVATLLECEALWSRADAAPTPSSRIDDASAVLDEVRDLVINPAHNTPRGRWWEAAHFQRRWWEHPPHVPPAAIGHDL